MAGLRLTVETAGFERLASVLNAAGKRIEPGIAGALNQVGRSGRAAMIRTLPQQTGLKRGTIVRFLVVAQTAKAGSLVYRIKGRGGDISLKYFGAREIKGGVSAKPWNKRTVFGGAFITSGLPGNRHAVKKLNGQVFRNVAGGRWGGKIEKLSSGLFLPKEMVTGETAAAWDHAIQAELPAAIDAAVRKALSL